MVLILPIDFHSISFFGTNRLLLKQKIQFRPLNCVMAHIKEYLMFWMPFFVHSTSSINNTYSATSNLRKVLNLTEDINPELNGFSNAFETQAIDTKIEDVVIEIPKSRIKRQSGGDKYTEAAKTPQVKVLRLLLQMLRNFWASAYVGGAHPFHHEVPKPVVALFREKVVDYLFPKVGSENVKT